MRKNSSFKTSIVAAAVFAGLVLSASSAHAALPAPMNWSGAYIGVHVGGQRAYFINDPLITAAENRAGNVIAGGQIGFNFQSGPHVFGLEADGSRIDLSASGPGFSYQEDWQATFRGRYGYAFDRFLPYLTAGVAVTGTEATAGATSESKTVLGYAAGGGVDVELCDRLSGRVEFLLTSVPRTNYAPGGTPMIGESDNETLRVGLNYSLGNFFK